MSKLGYGVCLCAVCDNLVSEHNLIGTNGSGHRDYHCPICRTVIKRYYTGYNQKVKQTKPTTCKQQLAV